MATITAKTFPGVYTQVIDRSFQPTRTSRFRPGLIGIASKGPFNTPTPVRSLQEFVRIFGNSIPTAYSTLTTDHAGITPGESTPVGMGYFLAEAVGVLAGLTDGIIVVRVGNTYKPLIVPTSVTGTAGQTTITTSDTNVSQVYQMLHANQEVYISISAPGKYSSINLPVESAAATSIVFNHSTLADTYEPGALIQYSNQANAAWSAESILYGYGYDEVVAVGKVSGAVKGQYTFDVAQNSMTLNRDALYAITDADSNDYPTYEFKIAQDGASAAGNIVFIQKSDITEIGYQALPLQASYTNGKLWKATAKAPFLILSAATPGNWANGNSAGAGLYTKVSPGSAASTKKIEVYWNSGLVETFDNLSANPVSPDFYTTRINGISSYIQITGALTSYGTASSLSLATAGTHAANTVMPWNRDFYLPNVAGGVPFGPTNAGILYSNVTTKLADQGGQFVNGFNGENAQPSDYVGVVNADDSVTGLKCFEDTDNVRVNVIAAPMDDIVVSVMQEMRRIAKRINAIAIVDVPAGLNIWQAIDWHNGAGAFRAQGRIDDPNIAVYWNWFTLASPFDGLSRMVPPSLAALRCMASTWEREKPWFAAAGDTRGNVPEALSVEFPRITDDAKQAMVGNGNCINPIWKTNGRFLVWGDRTMQRADSKLSSVHNVNLVNWILSGLSDLARTFVFDPNDGELLTHINLSFTEFLDKIKNERGIEEYKLVVDSHNNTADVRNQRAVIVDLSVVPVDVAERIYLNLTVRESGADLNSASY